MYPVQGSCYPDSRTPSDRWQGEHPVVVYYLADLNVVFSTRAMRSNTQVVLVVGLSTCAEAAILVFSFYWAPWIAGTFTSSALASAAPVSVLVDTSAGTSTEPVSGSGVAAGADGSTAEELAGAETTHLMAAASTVPFILIYSTLMMSAMLGIIIDTSHGYTVCECIV